MQILEITVAIISTVALSNIIGPFVKHYSLPLVQILLGVLASFLMPVFIRDFSGIDIEFELFFCLFVAPLLFIDAKDSNKHALMKNKYSILSFAIPLVFITVLIIAFLSHLIMPTISFVMLCALVSSLAPTDAVAISSLKGKVSISDKIMSILSGESLINDASGVVAFRYSLTAIFLTGYSKGFTISNFAIDFTKNFFYLLVGGAIIGLAFTIFKFMIQNILKRFGVENPSLHVLLEILTPFLLFIIAEHFETSGIIAVVISGVFHSLSRGQLNVESARQKVVMSSVWKMFNFILNGAVFVILGMQLPEIISAVLNNSDVNPLYFLLYSLGLMLGLYLLRFIWGYIICRDSRDSLILSLSGVKGAVTLATALSLPKILPNGHVFELRDYFILIAVIVILYTLLVSNFILPIIAKPKTDDSKATEHRSRAIEIEILQKVIHQLHEQHKEETSNKNTHNTHSYDGMLFHVISEYTNRLNKLLYLQKSGRFSASSLQKKIIIWQQKICIEALKNREVSTKFTKRFIHKSSHILMLGTEDKNEKLSIKSRTKSQIEQIKKIPKNKLDTFSKNNQRQLNNPRKKRSGLGVVLIKILFVIFKNLNNHHNQGLHRESQRFQEIADVYVLKRLRELLQACEVPRDLPKKFNTRGSKKDELDSEELLILIEEFELKCDYEKIQQKRRSRDHSKYQEAVDYGFRIEREIITSFYDDEKISFNEMKEMLKNIDLIDFALKN